MMNTQTGGARGRMMARGMIALWVGAVGAAPVPALAQGVAQQPGGQQQGGLSIPAQPLDQALAAFAAQTRIQVLAPAELTAGLVSAAVSDATSPQAALLRMLAGTGLVGRFTDARTVVVEKAAAAGAMTLDPVTVEALAGTRESAWGPVAGYVAQRSATGTKTDTPLVETPQSVSVISAEMIEDRKALSVEDAIAYTAGVRVGGSGNDLRFDQMSIRGFAATSSSDYLDGLRQTNTGWLSYFGSEPYGLERVEVVKGPASVLYGQINPGGLVNRVSKRPTEQSRHEIEGQIGSNDHFQGQFDMAERLSADGSVLARVVGVIRDASSDIEQIDNDTRYLAPSLTWKPNADTRVTLLSQYQFRRTGGSQRPYQQGTTLTEFWAGDEDFDKLEQTQYTMGWDAEHAVSDSLTLRQNLRFGTVETVNQYLSSGTLTSGHILSRTAYGVYENMDSLATDTQAQWKMRTGPVAHTLLGGLDYTWRQSQVLYAYGAAPSIDMWAPDYHQSISNPSTVISDLDNTAHLGGVYLQDQASLDRWRLTAGLRRDLARTNALNKRTSVHTKTDDSATTGRIGALYLFDFGLAPYASYATSFMPDGSTNVYGTPYKPTEGAQIEAGVKYQPPGHASLVTLAAYQLTQSNVKTLDPDNSLNYVQTGEQRSRGLELEGVAQLSDELRLMGSLTWSRVEVTRSNSGNEGLKPVNTPERLASLWADYTFGDGPLAGLGFGAGARWTGPSYNNSTNTLKNDDYTIADAVIHYDLDGHLAGARLALNVNNLFDDRYITCESGYCYRGAGRSVIGSIRYRW